MNGGYVNVICEKCGAELVAHKGSTGAACAKCGWTTATPKPGSIEVAVTDTAIEALEAQLRSLFPHGHPRFVSLSLMEMELHSAKNDDYAGGGDPLGNFRRTARILSNYPGLDPSDPTVVAMLLLMKQFDASMWLLSQGKGGAVENVGTRLADVTVYAKLAQLLWEDQQEGGEPKPTG